ncbi:MAG: ATP-binding cassette domain-containing protein [Candidatus Micrarchaeota archaeon]|nr:ATP-binding cassette domain-containing protein [Candidatus Micrarchaeota archaeon]
MEDAGKSIIVKDLVKRFGNFTAVDDISFEVKEGEIFGLLGPNGAGKTTTISILSTIVSLTSGSATVNGSSVLRDKGGVRNMIGIVFQDPSLDDELTGRQNLDLHARLYGVKGQDKKDAIKRALALVELEDKADRQVKTYSGGMKRRLEIARGFIHNPKVLFLDEPTIGLDPQTRRKIWEYISQLNEREKITMILTTHYMEEADELCDRIAIMDHGRIIKLDTAERLKDSLGGDIIRIGSDKPKELVAVIKKSRLASSVKEFESNVEIATKNGSAAIPKIIKLAQASKISIDYTTLKRPTLEDVFISLTGREIREEGADSNEQFKNIPWVRGGRR